MLFRSLFIAAVIIPWFGGSFLIQAVMIPFLIFSLAAIGLNLLTGYTGLLSLGTGAFMFVHPKQIAEIAARHPELKRLRLVVDRAGEQDTMTLLAEHAPAGTALESAVAATLQSITKLKGTVKLVAPGTLPNDGKLIADERKPWVARAMGRSV